MPMKRPPHPGGEVLETCLPGTGLSMEQAAEHLGVEADALADICYERAPITAEWAVRLAKAFGSSPEVWLGMQVDYDLALAQERFGDEEIARLPELSEAELDALEAGEMVETADVAD